MRKTRNYPDINFEIEPMLIENGMVDNWIWLQELKQRKLYLTDEITQYTVGDIVRHIIAFNTEDREIPPEERKPILLYIASNGGEMDSGFELIDFIKASKTPVYTVNLGFCYSMGFLIFLAGHKRYSAVNAKFLMHDGSSFVYNSTSKVKDQMIFNDKVESRVKDYILDHTKISSATYDAKVRTEWYMFADEAKKHGVTDFIIGQDCDLDEII